MPETFREPHRMDCSGLDLAHPLDRQPPGAFPYLQNVRVVEEGRIESRPGYTLYDSAATSFHTMRRLNDEDMDAAPAGYVDILGGGTQVWVGAQGMINPVVSGMSGNPLSILTFRPENSPEAWAYIYDAAKNVKVNGAKTVKQIGLPPPQAPIDAEYGAPNWLNVHDGQSATGWTALGGGSSGVPTTVSRNVGAGGAGQQIAAILYNSGTTGWACIVPDNPGTGLMSSFNGGPRMGLVINSAEQVAVREIHPSITGSLTFGVATPSTTIAGIKYDSGSTGACTIVLGAPPEGGNFALLARNSVLGLDPGLGNSELVRVLSVSLSPDGSTYSFRCVAAQTHAAGATVYGLLSYYCYTTVNHAALETLKTNYVQFVSTGAGSGAVTIQNTANTLNLSTVGGRPVSLANDYIHISLLGGGSNVAYCSLRLYTTLFSQYFQWIIPSNQFVPGQWTEFVLPFAQAQYIGLHKSLEAIVGIEVSFVEIDPTAVQTFGFDWWYVFGTFGPDLPPNDPVGYLYESRARDTSTGAASVPGPPTRHQLFPQREQIVVTSGTSSAPEADEMDIYRLGGTLSQFTYVGSVLNQPATPVVFADNQPDAIVAGNPAADVTLIQPWPIQDLPWIGTVSVVGTTVTRLSGTPFNTALVNASVILINGVAFQTYGQPSSANQLQIFANAGVIALARFDVAGPILAGQPLPFAFGPLEGPLVPVAFAIGDLKNPGTVYYSNLGNLDAASDANTVEVAGPSEPMVSGAVWNGLVIVGSRENIYLTRYSYLQTLGIPGPTTFQFNRLPSPSGMWSSWSCVAGQDGVYFLGRDGIYRATESGGVNISDERLYPIFPHDGQLGSKTNGIAPPDMSALASLRLSAADEDIYFDYQSVGS